MSISAPDFAPEYAAVADAPRSDDYARLVRLREHLTALNYTYDAVQELLGANAADAMARDQVVPGIWRVEQILRGEYSAEQKNLARLLAFFLLARPLTEAEAAEVFGETLQDFAEASLIEPPTTAPRFMWPRTWARISVPACSARITCSASVTRP